MACGISHELSGALEKKCPSWTFPAFPRRGARAIQTLDREGGAVGKGPRSAPYLLKLLTAIDASPYRARASRPSAPERNVTFLSVAQPPRLGKAGNVHLIDFLCKALPLIQEPLQTPRAASVGAVYERALFPEFNEIRAVIDRAYNSNPGYAKVSLIQRESRRLWGKRG
jgi:hypothetical protein